VVIGLQQATRFEASLCQLFFSDDLIESYSNKPGNADGSKVGKNW
jgi:hypothetical protein